MTGELFKPLQDIQRREPKSHGTKIAVCYEQLLLHPSTKD